ncbi:hypothetical protein WICPIJ_003421 [Wickerhamomyces pijperi]|uniref:Uncharacterized protein n=1 Tax=Wickerhamomyces pijperi TaxID=599730 RepID=A0A9P8TNR1_WICPI|nr:hypothetical protein WICPIJ_003421 [Wickerhamomyces pijperi]
MAMSLVLNKPTSMASVDLTGTILVSWTSLQINSWSPWCSSGASRINTSLSTIFTSLATWTAVKGLSPVIMIERWEDSFNMAIVSIASSFKGQWNTMNPAKVKPSSTEALSILVNLFAAMLSSNLVETADIDSTSQWDTEGLGTVDVELPQSGKRRVDSHGQLHWQFRWDNRGDNQNTIQDQLVLDTTHLGTFDPDVPGGSNGEDQEETNEEERFGVTDRDTFSRENHNTDKRTLGGFKPSLTDNSQGTMVRSSLNDRVGGWSIDFGDLRPFVISVDPNGERLDTHGSEFSHSGTTLEHRGELEGNQHEQSEQGIVPELIHQP